MTFTWLTGKTNQGGDPKKDILSTVVASRNGKVAKAIESFQACDSGLRAEIVQETVYHDITEGLVKLIAHAVNQDPDPYVRKVAHSVMNGRAPLRMQVLQHAPIPAQ